MRFKKNGDLKFWWEFKRYDLKTKEKELSAEQSET